MTKLNTIEDTGAVTGALNPLLRLEGAVLLLAMIAAYANLDQNWWLFAALFLAPDLFMLGYLAGKRIGAGLYNFGHTTIVPAALGAVGLATGSEPVIALAVIWLAHIGLDRLAGYGLKYGSGFKHTHLG